MYPNQFIHAPSVRVDRASGNSDSREMTLRGHTMVLSTLTRRTFRYLAVRPLSHPLQKAHDRLYELLPFSCQLVFHSRWYLVVGPSFQDAAFLKLFEAAGKRFAAHALQRLAKLPVPDWLFRAAERYEDFECSSPCNYPSQLGCLGHERRRVVACKVAVLDHWELVGFHNYTKFSYLA